MARPFQAIAKLILPAQRAPLRSPPWPRSRLFYRSSSSLPGQASQPPGPLPNADSAHISSRDSKWSNLKDDLQEPQREFSVASDDTVSKHDSPSTNPETNPPLMLTACRIANRFNLNVNAVLAVLEAPHEKPIITTWNEAAALVGLEAASNLEDAPSFEVPPTRMPDALFREIIDAVKNAILRSKESGILKEDTGSDLDLVNLIYGPIVVQFNGAMIREDHASTRGILKSCGGLTVVNTYVTEKDASRLAVATAIISQSVAFDNANKTLGFKKRPPIHTVLLDRGSLEVFRVDPAGGSLSLFRGVLSAKGNAPDSEHCKQLSLIDLQSASVVGLALPLRPICDIIFSVFLLGYLEALKTCAKWAHYNVRQEDEDDGSIFVTAGDLAVATSKGAVLASKEAAEGRMEEASQLGDIALCNLGFSTTLATCGGELPAGPLSC